MKIVLSRKGFDSQYGGVPSPVFPDGTAFSFPIPGRRSPTRFRDVRCGHGSLGPLVERLTRGRVRGDDRCHLDPDLETAALARLPGWRPSFGQVESAQGHLARQGVGPGDLFLFFGSFRRVEPAAAGAWRYVDRSPAGHRLFGWLQVAEVIAVGNEITCARVARPWLSAHPHLHGGPWPLNNTIYVSTRTLTIDGADLAVRGGGVFSNTDCRLTLTAPEATNRSHWKLPGWFLPAGGRPLLSYHGDEARWRRDGHWVHVHTVGRGQEFVWSARKPSFRAEICANSWHPGRDFGTNPGDGGA